MEAQHMFIPPTAYENIHTCCVANSFLFRTASVI